MTRKQRDQLLEDLERYGNMSMDNPHELNTREIVNGCPPPCKGGGQLHAALCGVSHLLQEPTMAKKTKTSSKSQNKGKKTTKRKLNPVQQRIARLRDRMNDATKRRVTRVEKTYERKLANAIKRHARLRLVADGRAARTLATTKSRLERQHKQAFSRIGRKVARLVKMAGGLVA